MVLAWLERRGTKKNRDGLARYGITAAKAFGVSMTAMQALAKQLGRNHALAHALWDTGWYEARTLVAFVADPAVTTAARDGRLVPRLRQLGDLRLRCASTCSIARRTPGPRSGSGRGAARSSRSAPASRCWRRWPLHDKTAPTSRFRTSLALIERAADRRAELRQEGRQLGAARDRPPRPGAAYRGQRSGRPAGPIRRRHDALGGEGHAPRSAATDGDQAVTEAKCYRLIG